MYDPQSFQKWSVLAKKFFGEEFWSETMGDTEGAFSGPKVDVYHTQSEVIVLIDMPGIEDVSQVTSRVQNQTLHLKGAYRSRYPEYEAVLRERDSGAFERDIDLNVPVTTKNSSASYKKGILEIRLHRLDL
ncbi:Hsp20/alpha crystallin family protein [Mechercharimyces sp. CAU 1602]|uniref:Hsp20/alpha crystallin family protein n=1 Tax=Mechercharimyces sp. CAU 1602 TaxID=2973933 RepID=UPI002161944B|nr:Hsp20/alpha crystallin family protein [Mechercharimyces sp. CAU 1602]MCS1352780.1 Hsp20/alpha crystallin family protein [Mechercharimyces sp. CAU 1602]